MLRSEIWLINLDPTVGAEIRKTRPAIIMSDDDIGSLPLRVVVLLTDWKTRYSTALWMVRIAPDDHNGLSKTSAADAFQMRSVSEQRFIRQVGTLSDEDTSKVEQALAIVLRIAP